MTGHYCLTVFFTLAGKRQNFTKTHLYHDIISIILKNKLKILGPGLDFFNSLKYIMY